MSKVHSFEFPGTREMFLEKLSQYPNNDHVYFYFNDYIVKVSGDSYDFGVARESHSGGYWYKPTVTETDSSLLFSGKIEYKGTHTADKGYKNVTDNAAERLLFVLMLPLFLLTELYLLVKRVTRKIRKQPSFERETTEDRLNRLMVDFLNCKQNDDPLC